MSKKVVKYADLAPVYVGVPAYLIPTDHPRGEFNGKWVHTSPVTGIVWQSANGPTFDTLNARYVPDVPDDGNCAADDSQTVFKPKRQLEHS